VLGNVFEADSPRQAVLDMCAYAESYCYQAGYRVTDLDTGESEFIDAEQEGLADDWRRD
jgi:hypothetical protein